MVDARVYSGEEGMFVVVRMCRVVRIRQTRRRLSWLESVLVFVVDWTSGSVVQVVVHLAVVARGCWRLDVVMLLLLMLLRLILRVRLVARLGGERVVGGGVVAHAPSEIWSGRRIVRAAGLEAAADVWRG